MPKNIKGGSKAKKAKNFVEQDRILLIVASVSHNGDDDICARWNLV